MNTTLDIALSNRDNYFSVIALIQSLNFDIVSCIIKQNISYFSATNYPKNGLYLLPEKR